MGIFKKIWEKLGQVAHFWRRKRRKFWENSVFSWKIAQFCESWRFYCMIMHEMTKNVKKPLYMGYFLKFVQWPIFQKSWLFGDPKLGHPPLILFMGEKKPKKTTRYFGFILDLLLTLSGILSGSSFRNHFLENNFNPTHPNCHFLLHF